uniref:Tachykinin n=1 Tax=Clastoptera arizonana TaxID=38151 RepID=A0A1B6D9J8_9HEMI
MFLHTLTGLICVVAVVSSTLTPAKGTVERRAPSMGFIGMRGKKDVLGDVKRSPSMGFMGMRGKKDDFFGNSQDLFSDEKRAMGFVGMRGKKDTDFEYDLGLPDDKRAPTMGFQAVRGKKDEYLKRAMGFVGMRGKKYDYTEEFPEDEFFAENFDKRAPSAGFVGMRGKKAPSNSGFFGMRGKKNPSSGFFGMRGKKVPISGFLGVRGKKDQDGGLEALLSELMERQEENDKRAPTPYNYRNFADSSYSIIEERPESDAMSQLESCQ